ncbi:hypothetical protein ABZ016_10405 [Streptomyces sp. NPDC006372]
MDLADALNVALAADYDTDAVLTLDQAAGQSGSAPAPPQFSQTASYL